MTKLEALHRQAYNKGIPILDSRLGGTRKTISLRVDGAREEDPRKPFVAIAVTAWFAGSNPSFSHQYAGGEVFVRVRKASVHNSS